MSLDSALRHPPKCRHASPRARRAHRVRLRQLFAELLADLGHQASVAERIALEAVSAATVRARRLRLQGGDDSEQMRLITHMLRATGLRKDPRSRAAQRHWMPTCRRGKRPRRNPAMKPRVPLARHRHEKTDLNAGGAERWRSARACSARSELSKADPAHCRGRRDVDRCRACHLQGIDRPRC